MNEAFDARFEFYKRAVRHKIDDLAFDLLAHLILALDVLPRVRELLLETEADAFLLAIHIENDDIDFLADLEDFARMANAAPAHVRDVQQSIEAIEVDERAKVGDVFHHALADVAWRHLRQQRGTAL